MIARKTMVILLLLFLVALIPRLAVTWQDTSLPESDEKTYDKYAMGIIEGDCETVGGRCLTTPIGSFTWRPPGYPLFLSFIYRLVGPSYRVVRICQAILSAFTCTLLYLIGKTWFNQTAGIVASLLVSCYGLMIYVPTLILSEALFNILMVGALWVLTRAERANSPWLFLASGCLMGLSAITRNVGITLVPVTLLYLVFKRQGRRFVRQAALLTLGAVLMIAPVTAKNYYILGNFVLVSNHGSLTFYRGVEKGVSNPDLLKQLDDEVLYVDGEGNPHDRSHQEAAIEYLRRYPDEIPTILKRKWQILMVHTTYTISHQRIEFVGDPYYWYGLLGLAVLGLVLRPGRNLLEKLLLVALIGAQILAAMVYDSTIRYRIPIVVLLALLAGLGAATAGNVVLKALGHQERS